MSSLVSQYSTEDEVDVAGLKHKWRWKPMEEEGKHRELDEGHHMMTLDMYGPTRSHTARSSPFAGIVLVGPGNSQYV